MVLSMQFPYAAVNIFSLDYINTFFTESIIFKLYDWLSALGMGVEIDKNTIYFAVSRKEICFFFSTITVCGNVEAISQNYK